MSMSFDYHERSLRNVLSIRFGRLVGGTVVVSGLDIGRGAGDVVVPCGAAHPRRIVSRSRTALFRMSIDDAA